MKRLISLTAIFIVIISSFVGCSGADNKVYIGEGKMTVIRSLIKANGFLANSVIGADHLSVNESEMIIHDSKTLAPVESDIISTYSDLERLVESTYTEDIAKKLLNEPKKYYDIDGKLYFDMQYSESENPKYDWSDFTVEFKNLNDDGSYLFKVSLKKTNGFSTSVKIDVTDKDGVIRLCDFYE